MLLICKKQPEATQENYQTKFETKALKKLGQWSKHLVKEVQILNAKKVRKSQESLRMNSQHKTNIEIKNKEYV